MECPQCDEPMHFSIGKVEEVHCDHCFERMKCVLQADEVLIEPVTAGTVTESETTAFLDGMEGVKVGSPANTTEFDISDAVTDSGLKDFLSRPVRIANFTWNESDSTGLIQTYSPWLLYFNNANIKYKLNNYAFIRANLKLKFVINASPFYYGSMRAAYQPLSGLKPSTIKAASGSELIPYSQQPGVWLKPQHSEGAELTLPFFYQRSYLKVQSANDFTQMGTLRMLIYNVLQSANGVTGQGVTVQVYAWAEDVILAGPTVGLSMQADEYGTGPVSGPASTIAAIAGKVKGIPIFGKFATATEMGARAVAGIAKLFGFTNVPVIEPTQPYRPSPFPQLASPELGYPTEKLTLDSKNELSIDPSILGLKPEDELAIERFVTRESYLTSVAWSTSTTVDTPLFTSKVTPHLYQYVAPVLQQTPLDVASSLFQNWRGDIIYTFRFIASPFHRGRVRVSYDPYGSAVQTTGDTGPTVFNKVVDLSAETEIDIRVPYQQALAWQNRDTALTNTTWSISTTPTLVYDDTFDNGMISVKVLTLLSAPVSTSTVYMQVFVRAAENFELGNPKDPPQNITPFTIQSDEYMESIKGEEHEMGSNDGSILVQRNRINFGECIRSMRQLLRRSNFIDSFRLPSATSSVGYFRSYQFRFPPYFGYDTTGLSSVKGINAPASNFNFNFVKITPWHVLANCFLAHRGSAHWHYNIESSGAQTMYVRRASSGDSNTPGQLVQNNNTVPVASTASAYAQRAFNSGPTSSGGLALTNQLTNSGLSVSVPNYSQFKFESTNPQNFSFMAPLDDKSDGSFYEMIELGVEINTANYDPTTAMVSRYYSVGTDYNVYFFLNCPSWNVMNTSALVPN